MSELDKILWTALATILSGSFIFVISQFASRFILEPVIEVKRVVGEIIFVLLQYDTVNYSILDIENEDDFNRLKDAKRDIREKGSRIVSASFSVPYYDFFRLLFRLPSRIVLISVGQTLLQIADRLGESHSPTEMDELSKMILSVAKKLGVEFKQEY